MPVVEVDARTVLTERASGFTGRLVRFGKGLVVLRDERGRQRTFHDAPGAFSLGDRPGRPVVLRAPAAAPRPRAATASGSLAPEVTETRVARPSRLLVEGLHDAELIERIWGDDLRAEGVVVGVLDGADELRDVVAAFGPGPERRLGVLLDHLIAGSKERRIADTATHPWVRIAGHPFVDVWQAVRPSVIGIAAWPDVPPGEPWKDGVLARLGVTDGPAAFWRQVLGSVSSYADLEPELVGAVESLVDFVAPPDGEGG